MLLGNSLYKINIILAMFLMGAVVDTSVLTMVLELKHRCFKFFALILHETTSAQLDGPRAWHDDIVTILILSDI